MKKYIALLIALLSTINICAEERPITFGELPENAKIFVLTYFKGSIIKEVYIERRASLTQYEITLKEGIELQFDRTGACTEISSKKGKVPDIVIPPKILQLVQNYFPKNYIQKIEHNGRMHEVELDNGTILTFNNSLRLVDVD